MALPVDPLLPEIQAVVRGGRDLILRAEPGAGKTTRVPPALLDAVPGQVLVLEPRRLAARLAAAYIAAGLGERVGETVGYHIRLERVFSRRTRLKFITEGLFLKYLARDSGLAGVDCLVLDEFHERHLHTDVALAVARQLQRTRRPDLRLVVMSATLDTERLGAWFGDAVVLDAPGRVHPVAEEFLPHPDRRSLAAGVREAVAELLSDPRCPGHVLVFLPGAADIRRCAESLAPLAARTGARVLPLMAELPLARQQEALALSAARKLILATNVAETSITIDGVTGVVDPGLAKIPGFAPWSGLPTLDVRPVSQASCSQRAGRAGRTAPGVVRRLFTRQDFAARPPFTPPEISRLELSGALLDLAAVAKHLPAAADPSALPWLDPPPAVMLESCRNLLALLGAVDSSGRLTSLGEEMAGAPLHPRLARVTAEGRRRGIAGTAALAAVLVNEGMVLRSLQAAPAVTDSDVLWQMELLLAWISRRELPAAIREAFDRQRAERIEALYRQLVEGGGLPSLEQFRVPAEEEIAACFLAGFPDRVAQVRAGRAGRRAVAGSALDRIELALCQGGGARLSPGSTVRDSRFLVAVAAEDSPSRGDAALSAEVRVAVGIEPELLLAAPADFLKETTETVWDGEGERVVCRSRLTYGGLLLEETPAEGDPRETARVLARALADRWPKPFPDDAPLRQYAARLDFLRRQGVEAEFPNLAGEEFDDFMRSICQGKRSFVEIARSSLKEYIDAALDSGQRSRLDRLAPERITLGSGRRVAVNYELGAIPWIGARLQEFFGTARTPALADGRVPLVVHLQAPSGRALQVTTDLAGFWEREYPKLRNAYMRRYPRHPWPEDPLAATPPPKKHSPQRHKGHKD